LTLDRAPRRENSVTDPVSALGDGWAAPAP
jgi:hypothetical protein